ADSWPGTAGPGRVRGRLEIEGSTAVEPALSKATSGSLTRDVGRRLADGHGQSSAIPQQFLRTSAYSGTTLQRMRNVPALILCVILQGAAFSLSAADRDLTLAREMLEDSIIRDDAEGIRQARERLLAIAANADDRTILRDAHYLVALSAMFESINAYRD